jgi:hypothetical protein
MIQLELVNEATFKKIVDMKLPPELGRCCRLIIY